MRPLSILIWLLGAALAVSGWIYGLHWKKVARGDAPTHEEQLLIDLQDQIEQLRLENDRLTGEMKRLQKNPPE